MKNLIKLRKGKSEFCFFSDKGLENENKKVEIKNFCPPCGVCRQVLAEFCSKDFKIILAKSKTDYKVLTLGELLPEVFSL